MVKESIHPLEMCISNILERILEDGDLDHFEIIVDELPRIELFLFRERMEPLLNKLYTQRPSIAKKLVLKFWNGDTKIRMIEDAEIGSEFRQWIEDNV